MSPNKTLCGLGVGIGVEVLGSKGITLWFELSFDKGYIIQGISSPFFLQGYLRPRINPLTRDA